MLENKELTVYNLQHKYDEFSNLTYNQLMKICELLSEQVHFASNDEIVELEDENRNLEEDNERLEEENDRLCSWVSLLESENDKLKKELNELKRR